MGNELDHLPQPIQELRERIIAQSTYTDAFALALARARNNTFYADTDKWQKTIHRLKTTELDKEKLFDDIHFDVRRPEHPWSPEVSKFLTAIISSGIFERFQVGDESVFQMTKQAKEEVEQNHSYPLKNYSTIINSISMTFDQELGVKIEEPQ